MTVYLLTGPESSGRTIVGGAKKMLVHAPSANVAKRLAGKHVSGMSANFWAGASAAAIAAAAGWAGWSARVQVRNPSTGLNVIDETVETPASYSVATISAGSNKGSGYVANNKLYITGAAGDDTAEVNVDTVAVGAAATITKATNGSYTVNPDGSNKATTGGTGTGLTINVASSGGAGPYTLGNVTIGNSAGTGYVAGDVVTVTAVGGGTGGTVTINTVDGLVGAVLTFTLNDLDRGIYASDPVATNKATTTNGSGTGCTITVATSQGGASGDIDELGIALVTALNANALISHAAFNQSTNVLTVAGTSDALGDYDVLFDLFPPDCDEAMNVPVGSITDKGSSGSALTVALPADNYAIPAIIARLRGV